jgi:uncharacterized membrane protein
MLVAATLCLCVLAAELLARHTRARVLGAALLVILIGGLVANLGLIPTGAGPAPVPVYAGVFQYAAPLSIFWLLLQVELRRVVSAGPEMIGLFVLGSLGTVVGAVLGIALIRHGLGGDGPPLAGQAGPVAGMYVGTYTGGSINFNAIALHYRVTEQGVVFAGAVAVDNVLTAVWMVVTLLAPKLVWRVRGRSLARAQASPASPTSTAAGEPPDREVLGPTRLAIILGLGLASLALAEAIAEWLAIPSMIALTLVALILAQLRPWLQRALGQDPFVGAQALGMFAVYLFLAVVGAHADVRALAAIGPLGLELALLAATTILVHGAFVFGGAALLRLDPDAAAVASQANVGGGTTALALARSLGREELAAPGILVGALGTALGTFLGFAVAAWIAGWIAG